MQKPRVTSKEVTIEGEKFLIRKMTAENGSWVAAQLITKALPGIMGKLLEGMLERPLPMNQRAELTESEFHNLQRHCLNVCSRFEVTGSQSVPMPLITEQGTWAIADLADDAVTIMTLTVHALVFNVGPFFNGDVLSAVLASFSDTSLLSPSK